MTDDAETPLDANGVALKSGAHKNYSPKVPTDDLVAVRIGPEELDYEYVDPASLVAAERLVRHLRVNHQGQVKEMYMKGWRKFVRDLVVRAMPYWPPGGYIERHRFEVPPLHPHQVVDAGELDVVLGVGGGGAAGTGIHSDTGQGFGGGGQPPLDFDDGDRPYPEVIETPSQTLTG